VQQLEHALRTRVVVEQAIGVLAERHRIAPRTAFERLRRAARCRGKKVAALAHEVVESTRNPLVALPEELAREGSAVQAWPPKRAS
jgi:AmiR/NasT family two-component response regulator